MMFLVVMRCMHVQVDGRMIGSGTRGLMCSKLQELYVLAMDAQADKGHVFVT